MVPGGGRTAAVIMGNPGSAVQADLAGRAGGKFVTALRLDCGSRRIIRAQKRDNNWLTESFVISCCWYNSIVTP